MPPERLARWIAGFFDRHDGAAAQLVHGDTVVLQAVDRSVAEIPVPFPPLSYDPSGTELPAEALVQHASLPRVLGLLIVRRGGFGIAVLAGDQVLDSKVGRRHVQGRTAAGGWSQQRFARRREGQTRVAADATADHAARLLLPARERLTALVTGGDHGMVEQVLADPRLAPLRPLVAERFLAVPDPDRRSFPAAVTAARALPVLVRETDAPPAD